MDAGQVSQKVNQNQLQPDWILYPLNKSWVAIQLAWFGFVVILGGLISLGIVLVMIKTGSLEWFMWGTTLFFLLCALYGLGKVLKYGRYLVEGKTWLLLTSNACYISLAGRLEFLPYSELTQLRLIMITGNTMKPKYKLSYVSAQSGREVDLLVGHLFGDLQMIYRVLNPRL